MARVSVDGKLLLPGREQCIVPARDSVQKTVRVLGKTLLLELADSGGAEVAASVAALSSELEEGQWREYADFLAHFPRSTRDRGFTTIFLGQTHRVDLAVNFERQIAIIAYAGSGRAATSTSEEAIPS